MGIFVHILSSSDNMYIIPLIIVYYAVFKMVKDYEPIEKRIRKRDANPYNTVKSNLWKGEDEKW